MRKVRHPDNPDLTRRTGLALTWVFLVVGGIWLVHSSEQDRRDGLEQSFSARAETSAQFVGSYARDVFAREEKLAKKALTGTVGAASFSRLISENGFEASVLLDAHGHLLDSYPTDPGLVGTDLAGKYAHLDGALAGVPTVSGVVLSAVKHVPVVAFAVPFDTPQGRRVFSGAYVISKTPLQSYLDNQIDSGPETIYLVDATGSIVSSYGAKRTTSQDLQSVDPALAAAAVHTGARTVGTGDAQRWSVTEEVPGTPWRVVYAVPTKVLLGSVAGFSVWAARIVLVALALAGLVMIGLFERLVSQRSRLADQQEQSRAVLDGAVNAFVGTDDSGRVTEWNPAAEAMFGWRAQEAVGKPISELLGSDEVRSAPAIGMSEIVGGSARRGPDGLAEVVALHRDGARVPVEASLFSTRLRSGVRWYAFLRDLRPRQVIERRTRTLAQVAESAGDAIYSRDLVGRIMSWNASAERLYGWTAEQMIGRNLSHEMIGDGREQMEQVLAEVTRNQAVRYFEADRYTVTGKQLDVGLTVAPLVDEAGVMVGVSVIARDIGEARRLEEQLRHSEGVFRSAFDNALLGMHLVDPDGRLIRVNKVFADMLGRSVDDLVGVAYDVIEPAYRGPSAAMAKRALDGETERFRDEICYRDVNGTPVWAEISASLVRDQAGEPLHFVTQVVDVTQRRAALQERESRDAMLAAVIAISQSLIHVTDLDGRYLLANEPFVSAFGVSEADLLNSTEVFLHPVVPTDGSPTSESLTDGAIHLEEWSDGPDGRHFYESVRFTLRDDLGLDYAVCGVSLDVTEQRRAVEAVARARDEAVAATAAKSSFLATMSHEIRTPMNAVIGMTGLLLDTDLDRRQREFVETVRSSGDALLLVINDILDFSKLEAGQVQLEQRAFDLTEAVEGSLDLVAGAAAAKALDLVCHLDESCPRSVVGDETRLRQVLVNLLSNAVKFTASGDVLVTVSAETDDVGSHLLTFAVTDTGVGIPAERMSRLFQSFSQVDDSTTRVYGGTGLGLAISRRIVKAMGGDLQVTSTVGRGSTFSFSAPFGRSAVGAGAPNTAEDMTGSRVLVVDDNPTNLRILALQLAAYSIAGTPVATPAEAVALVRDGAVFDAAIIDMQMPEMDGQELAAELRRLPGGRDLPLLLLTSLGGPPGDVGSPGVDYLTKPVKSAALHEALVGVLSASPGDQAPRRVVVTEGAAEMARRLRVLLVEDNSVNQRVAQLMLRKLGHLVDTVGNGREAVEAVHAAPYDVVLMDVQMPVMDGLEATRLIRSAVTVEHQPHIVAMTASALIEDRAACMAAGMDAYLPKPVRAAELRRAVDAVVVTTDS